MYTVITIIIITSISGICAYDTRICFVCVIISFHEWYISFHIIRIATDIDMSDVFAAYSHLHIISRFEYSGIVIIIIFHMHKCRIRVCLRETVAFFQYIQMERIFIHFQRIFLQFIIESLDFMLSLSLTMFEIYTMIFHILFNPVTDINQIVKSDFMVY